MKKITFDIDEIEKKAADFAKHIKKIEKDKYIFEEAKIELLAKLENSYSFLQESINNLLFLDGIIPIILNNNKKTKQQKTFKTKGKKTKKKKRKKD